MAFSGYVRSEGSVRRFIRQFLLPFFYLFVRPLIGSAPTRKWFNRFFMSLSISQYFVVYKVLGQAFRDSSYPVEPGEWKVRFLGKDVRMPLRKETFSLDWETALSIIGHEYFIKQTYANLLTSSTPPTLFIDIGANFGTHSLLFTAHGIPCLSFDPNEVCHQYFMEACKLNGFPSNWQGVALGENEGELELVFPEKETWLGTTVAEQQAAIATHENLIRKRVPLKTLDSYGEHFQGKRALMKIDTEGAELGVLRGAVNILKTHQPTLLFESFPGAARGELFDFFARLNYGIKRIDLSGAPFTRDEFMNHPDFDFMGVPQ